MFSVEPATKWCYAVFINSITRKQLIIQSCGHVCTGSNGAVTHTNQ